MHTSDRAAPDSFIHIYAIALVFIMYIHNTYIKIMAAANCCVLHSICLDCYAT